MEEDFFYHELKELKVHKKWQILEVFLPFISFLHAYDRYDRKRGHNMFVLMLDPRFKKMKFNIVFLGRENVVVIVVEYDQHIMLLLLTKTTKLLMFANVEAIKDL
jgi:hypothetical protein